MEKKGIEKKFDSPEEELSFLRSEVARREKEMAEGYGEARSEVAAGRVIREYRESVAGHASAPKEPTTRQEAPSSLGLTPESHDAQMAELRAVVESHGVKNALKILADMGNPHLDDDFERFLVQYVKSGVGVSGLKEKTSLWRVLHMTLYEVTLPERDPTSPEKTLKELVSSMEQFYAGMMSVEDKDIVGPNYFTLELSVSNHSDEFVFYAAVPDSKRNLFEKQIVSIFHNAKIAERKDDYNIFNETGAALASYATLRRDGAYPLKTYEQFDHDPLSVLLNSFSKIDRDGEGAAIQIIFNPSGGRLMERYKKIVANVAKGMSAKDALAEPDTIREHAWHTFKEVGRELFSFTKTEKEKKKEKGEPEKPEKVDEITLEFLKQKIATPVVEAEIRIVASSKDGPGAAEILADLESAFNQFENTNGNKLVFKRLSGGKLGTLLHNFSFRLFSEERSIPLNLKELTTLMHFPSTGIKTAPQLKVAKAASAPAPLGLPDKGVFLGTNYDRGGTAKIFMASEDRLRHFYTIGQTGTGKTTLLKNMAVQDIQSGAGVCLIDPHGTDIQDILAAIPKERFPDVIYFDPAYTARPMALNMLEYDRRFPEQKTFVVNELFSIFQKLYGAVPESMGPMFEQYFRNATMLVIEDLESGSTLLDVSRVMSVKSFRELKISKCKNPVVVQFWKEIAEKAGGEGALQNMVPYITSKFDVFLANDIMRPIIAQEHSSFNFRSIMDERKILLVNLSKGRLGDINSNLIGLIIIGKILMAALSRVDSLSPDTPPFYLYVDEFQNITTNSIATILSEARKYKLSLHIAHQFIKQLDEKIKDAVFGNVGSIAAFRVGAEDAEFLEKQFSPVFTAKDIMNLDNHNAYLKLLVHGRPAKPFNIETPPPPSGVFDQVDQLKELSYLKFGRERAEVEAEIAEKYRK